MCVCARPLQLIQRQGKEGFFSQSRTRIVHGTLCCYAPFSKVDLRVEVTIPGSTKAYCVNARGERSLFFSCRAEHTHMPRCSCPPPRQPFPDPLCAHLSGRGDVPEDVWEEAQLFSLVRWLSPPPPVRCLRIMHREFSPAVEKELIFRIGSKFFEASCVLPFLFRVFFFFFLLC